MATISNGKKTFNVPSGDHLRGKVPPQATLNPDDGSIFVAVPSYRDGERCGNTLRAIFENAEHPEKIQIGVVEQNAPEDAFCIEVYCKTYGVDTVERKRIREGMTKAIATDPGDKCPYFHQIRLVGVHDLQAKGPTFARSLARKVLGNEEYCMQIDAHSDFVKNWDTLLKEEWKHTKNEFAVISTVPPPISEKNDLQPGGSKEREVPRACAVRFMQHNGVPMYDSPADFTAVNLEKPLLSHTWSAAFSFAKCHFEESVPNDSFSYYAKPVEQVTRFARMWTRGYDVYTPTKNLVFHEYRPQDNGHGNDEWFKHQKPRFRSAAVERAKMILEAKTDEPLTNVDRANIGIYGLGKRRTLKQLQDFMHVDFLALRDNAGEQLECVGHEWVPYDENISPTTPMHDNPSDLESQPQYPLRTNMVFYEQVIEEPLSLVKVSHALPNKTMVHVERSGPSGTMLFLLWIFGLVVWFAVFVGGSLQSSRTKRQKHNLHKDI